MATKKDLIEAQQFSRNRLLSAFVGGAPGGKELEPAKPMRAVFGGIALSAMVIIAGLFIGFLNPGLPNGWENNRLIVARDTGARYISVDGSLYPIINTVSARMLIPPGEFSVVSINQSSLGGIHIGGTIGILGGPDTLPKTSDLDGTGWRACGTSSSTKLWVGGQDRDAAPENSGTVVTRDGETFVIWSGSSFAVPAGQETAVLRAVGLDGVEPFAVRGEWLALFSKGEDLSPITTQDSGKKVAALDLPAGSVIHPTGSADDDLYLLTATGELSQLTPFAHRLYMLGGGGTSNAAGALGEPVDVNPSKLADLPTTKASASDSWPLDQLVPQELVGSPCATLKGSKKDQHTILAAEGDSSSTSPENKVAASSGIDMRIPENTGALLRGGPTGALTLVDATGTTYAVPGDLNVGVKRLGYEMKDVAVLPAGWIHLLPAGPELTEAAAGATPAETKTTSQSP